MNTYSVEADGNGRFQVRIIVAGESTGRMVGTFATEREAEDWVNGQIKLALKSATASDVA